MNNKKPTGAAQDTYAGMPLAVYLEVVEALGFKKVFEKNFPARYDPIKDTVFVFWHQDGILLKFDTWRRSIVSGGEFFYNIVMSEDQAQRSYNATSSGHFAKHNLGANKYVWVGYHDCQTRLISNIERLRSAGKFLREWVECPPMWLYGYGEEASRQYRESARAREIFSCVWRAKERVFDKQRLSELPPEIGHMLLKLYSKKIQELGG